MSRRSKKAKAGRVVTRTLADGSVKTYRYGAYKRPKTGIHRDSVEALIKAYKGSPEWRALSEGTQINRAAYLRSLDDIGHLQVKDVTRRAIMEIRDAIAGTRGNGAADNFRQAASVLFAWAAAREWISRSPVFEIGKLSGGELPAWTPEQANIALQGLPERLRRVVILGLYTGQRRVDLCSARWKAYDGQFISFLQQKTGITVDMTVHPDLKAELDAWKIEATSEFILTNGWGKPWLPNTLSIVLPRAFKELGLPPGLNVHGMRKLFAAGMAANGASVHEIGSNTGHKTLSMIQHYTRSADLKKLSEGAVGKIQTFTIAKKDG